MPTDEPIGSQTTVGQKNYADGPAPEPSVPGEVPNEKQADQRVSDEEQAAYEEAMEEIKVALYQNEQASDGLVGMIQPDDKNGTTAKTAVTLVSQIDEKISLDESVVHSVLVEAVDRLVELAETSKGMEFTDNDVQKIYMASWEGIMGVFGGEDGMQESYDEMARSVSKEDLQMGQQKYQEIMNG